MAKVTTSAPFVCFLANCDNAGSQNHPYCYEETRRRRDVSLQVVVLAAVPRRGTTAVASTTDGSQLARRADRVGRRSALSELRLLSSQLHGHSAAVAKLNAEACRAVRFFVFDRLRAGGRRRHTPRY